MHIYFKYPLFDFFSRGYVYCFCQMFQRLHLFKGLRLFQTLEKVVTAGFRPECWEYPGTVCLKASEQTKIV